MPGVKLDQPADDRQADTKAAMRAIERVLTLREEVEDARQRRRIDAPPIVLQLEHGFSVMHTNHHFDLSGLARELDRIVEQVRDHLIEARLVAVHPRRLELRRDGPGL